MKSNLFLKSMSQVFSQLIIVACPLEENHILMQLIEMNIDTRHTYLEQAIRYLPVLK